MFDDPDALKERLAAFSGAIFLFGLAGLIMLDLVWPGILLLIWLTSIPVLMAEKGFLFGLWLILQTTIWLVGLPFFFMTGLVWPGILILAGMSALLVAIAPPDRLDRRHQRLMAERRLGREMMQKRKRGLPVPPASEWLERPDGRDADHDEWDPADDGWGSAYEDDDTGRLSRERQN